MTDLEFENTVRCYSDMLYRIAFNYLKSEEDSEDALQNSLIRLYRYQKGFKSEEHIKAWLIRVTINESKRILSQNRKRAVVDIEAVADQLYVDEIEKRDFSIELMKMNPIYSTVLCLYYFEGYRAKEIAVLLSKTTAAVNLILSRARKQLKKHLQEDNNDGKNR